MITVVELRQKLVEEFGYEESEAKLMKKPDLLEAIKQQEAIAEGGLDDFTEEEATECDVEMNQVDFDQVTKIPSRTDPKWTDFILSELDEAEKVKDKPTVGGLRRLAEKYVGEIMEMNVTQTQLPAKDNNERAAAIVEIIIDCGEGKVKRFDGAADARKDSLISPFDKHLL